MDHLKDSFDGSEELESLRKANHVEYLKRIFSILCHPIVPYVKTHTFVYYLSCRTRQLAYGSTDTFLVLQDIHSRLLSILPSLHDQSTIYPNETDKEDMPTHHACCPLWRLIATVVDDETKKKKESSVLCLHFDRLLFLVSQELFSCRRNVSYALQTLQSLSYYDSRKMHPFWRSLFSPYHNLFEFIDIYPEKILYIITAMLHASRAFLNEMLRPRYGKSESSSHIPMSVHIHETMLLLHCQLEKYALTDPIPVTAYLQLIKTCLFEIPYGKLPDECLAQITKCLVLISERHGKDDKVFSTLCQCWMGYCKMKGCQVPLNEAFLGLRFVLSNGEPLFVSELTCLIKKLNCKYNALSDEQQKQLQML